jgi:hypothetical protein
MNTCTECWIAGRNASPWVDGVLKIYFSFHGIGRRYRLDLHVGVDFLYLARFKA